MRRASAAPALSHLFKMDEANIDRLDTATSDLFHHCTTQLLFLSKHASRLDIQTAVAFFCTRVRSPDTDDYKKLAYVMKYFQMYSHLPLILGSDGKGDILWSMDEAFAVHKPREDTPVPACHKDKEQWLASPQNKR